MLNLNGVRRKAPLCRLITAIGLIEMALAGGLFTARAFDEGASMVKIDNFSFGPHIVTVPVGTTIVWRNEDDIPHSVVAADMGFRSQAMDTDETFSFAFTKPGEVDYFCGIHPFMTGKVVVAP